MPTCQKCGNQWSWLQTTRKLFTFKRGKKCPHCGGLQYFKASARQSWFLLLVPFIFIVLPALGVANRYILGISCVAFIVNVMSRPFFSRLCNDPEKGLFIHGSKYFD